MISGHNIFLTDSLDLEKSPRKRSFTLGEGRGKFGNRVTGDNIYNANMGNMRAEQEKSPRQQRNLNESYRRSKSLRYKKEINAPKIILPDESNRILELRRYKAEIEEDIRISTIKLRTLSLTRLRNSNPELYEEYTESHLSPTLFRSIRHASCGDISAEFSFDESTNNNNLSVMRDSQMTSSNMNLNEINVRNTAVRKKSKPQIMNIELRKRAIEARVKQRKRGETLKSLDEDFLKAKFIMDKYKTNNSQAINTKTDQKNAKENE